MPCQEHLRGARLSGEWNSGSYRSNGAACNNPPAKTGEDRPVLHKEPVRQLHPTHPPGLVKSSAACPHKCSPQPAWHSQHCWSTQPCDVLQKQSQLWMSGLLSSLDTIVRERETVWQGGLERKWNLIVGYSRSRWGCASGGESPLSTAQQPKCVSVQNLVSWFHYVRSVRNTTNVLVQCGILVAEMLSS